MLQSARLGLVQSMWVAYLVDCLPQGRIAARLEWLVMRHSLERRIADGRDGQIGHPERGVRESEAELVLHAEVVVIEMAVVDQQTLAEVGLPGIRVSRVEQGGRVGDVRELEVVLLKRDGVGQVAGGIDVAVQHVHDAVAGFLAAEVRGEDGSDVRVVSEGEDVEAAAVRDDDRVGTVGRDGVDQAGRVPGLYEMVLVAGV